jgi:hypothetical protein
MPDRPSQYQLCMSTILNEVEYHYIFSVPSAVISDGRLKGSEGWN